MTDTTTPTYELPGQNEDPFTVPYAIQVLAARICEDLATNDERFYTEGVDSWRVTGADLFGEVQAVAVYNPADGVSTVLVNDAESPIQQMRALLAEVEGGLGNSPAR